MNVIPEESDFILLPYPGRQQVVADEGKSIALNILRDYDIQTIHYKIQTARVC
jgi:hypothetical protein